MRSTLLLAKATLKLGLIADTLFRPVRFNLHLSMHFIEPEALAEPRRRKSASASGSVSSQLISIVQVALF